MPHLVLMKIPQGWASANKPSEEFHAKKKLGTTIHSDFKEMRNAGFHRKLFALFNLAFEYWEPAEINHKFGVPEKNFERFRKDLTILAGHYHIVIRLDGTAKPEADSLAFGNMDNETFEKLYNNALNVILNKIPVLCKLGKNEVNELVDKFLEFG